MRHILYRFAIDFYYDSDKIKVINQAMGGILMGYGYGYYGIDFTYLVLVIPALLISLYAQFKVKGAFARYSQERCVTGLTGAEAARRILLHPVPQ